MRKDSNGMYAKVNLQESWVQILEVYWRFSRNRKLHWRFLTAANQFQHVGVSQAMEDKVEISP